MKKTTFFKTLLLGVALLMGGDAWAAGYTRTLSGDYTLAGYKAKTFYNFQNNTPEVLPTSGDLRYRDGGIWGLHNYGSGNRSATATIPVNEGEVLVLQHYSRSTVATINRGTINSTLTSSNSYEIYDITSTADDITFSIARYGGIVAALVMEKDADVSTADYTINYKAGETIVKTVSGTEAVGGVVSIESSVWNEGVKYITDEGEISTYTVVAGENIVNISVTVAELYNYTVNATAGENVIKVLASGSAYSGESVSIAYPAYFNINGTLYNRPGVGKGDYHYSFVASEDNQEENLVYSETGITNVVYYSEAEEIEGATATSAGSNMNIRSSNAQCGYTTEDVTLINLPAGVYKATMVCYSNSSGGATQHFSFGDESYDASISGSSNWTTFTKEFTLETAADVKWLTSGNANNGLDFIYIQEVNETASVTSAGYATFSSTYAVDFSGVAGLKAYIITGATGNSLSMTQVTSIPANTGVVLEGAAGNYEIPVVASSATDVSSNKLVAVDEDITAEVGTYVLQNQDGKVGFYLVEDAQPKVAAGRAYLPASIAEAKTRALYFNGEATGIDAVNALMTGEYVEIYNAAGVQVESLQKGLNIVKTADGKTSKVFVK